ncbi:hypothetical protein HYU23_01035 [Candidatus Woesearchaeota archaeon]|nr:hypothetical protein [Candidatus Woesearchaeota archaeon]
MKVLETLYFKENHELTRRVWDTFIFLNPKLPFLKTGIIKKAIEEKDRTYPTKAFKFKLYPDETDDNFTRKFTLSMNHGIRAINSLITLYLNETLGGDFRLQEVQQRDLFDFLRAALENKNRATNKGGKIVNPELIAEAYSSMRAIDLGYRVCTVDQCSEVLNSLRYIDEIVKKLEGILGFKEGGVESYLEGIVSEWNTDSGVVVYSKEKTPMPKRLKYLALDNSPKYSSILMKMYRKGLYPNQMRDYVGVEVIVRDNEERDRLIEYIRRNTSPTHVLEDYTDLSKGQGSSASGAGYGMKKFVLRVPVKMAYKIPIKIPRTLAYESVPVEFQVLTLEDHKQRIYISEASHFEYKRRQFMELFPVLFPKQIYASLLA